MLRCLLLLASTNALHLHIPAHRPTSCRNGSPVAPRANVRMAKLISRNRLDFASGEVKHEFGLQGDILGLAPRADAGMLIVLALLIARTHRLPLADLAFAIAFPAYLMTANALRFDGNKIEQRFQPLLREGRGRWFKRYVASYALFGLALPTPFVFFAPRAVAVAAAPHLFLTAIQVRVSQRTPHHAAR